MVRDPPETTELQAFVRVVEAGSVAAAAVELAQPRATVSRRLARLEERLGVRLLRRSSRRMVLTDAGEELFRHARSIVHAVDAAAEAVRRDDDRPRGLLRVAAPPHATGLFSALILSFLEAYPEVELEILHGTRHEDLVASGFDLAIRATTTLDPGLIARRIAVTRLIAVAAPRYLDQRGRPGHLDELGAHVCLVGYTRGERPATHWPRRDGDPVRVQGRLVSNEPHLLLDAAVQGFGLAVLPEILCRPALEQGALEVVLAEQLGGDSHLALVYPDRKYLKPAARVFIDHAVAHIGDAIR